MLSYTHCNQCNALLSYDLSAEEAGDHFLYCSKDCKQKKADFYAEKRKASLKTHRPWDRMSEEEQEDTKRTLKTEGPVVWDEATIRAADLQDKLNAEKEAQANGKDTPSSAENAASGSSDVPSKGFLRPDSKAGAFLNRAKATTQVSGSTPRVGKGKGSRKCGRCGGSGHNARTCSKR